MQEQAKRPAVSRTPVSRVPNPRREDVTRLPRVEAAHLGEADVLRLQATAGNSSVSWLIGQHGVQRAADVVPYAAESAKTVKETWEKGSVTDTETSADIESQEYMKWRVKAQQAIAKLKKSKAAADKTRAGDLQKWITEFEARQKWLLRNPPAAAGSAAATPTPAASPSATPTPAASPSATATPGPSPSPKAAPAEPKDPGNAPAEITKAAGAVPSSPFRIVHKWDVTMPDKHPYAYRDDPIKYPYKYMQTEAGGIDAMGVPLARRTDVNTLFDLAGITDTAQRKGIRMVSAKEAAFENVQTYDTGFVSVGAIQFTTGATGDGTMVGLLKTAKAIDPTGYATFFHDLGIDIEKKGGKEQLVVVDPATGNIREGADAVQAIISDKRLTAVFQNAGENWQNYRVAQLKSAIAQYWVTGHSFTVMVEHTGADGKTSKISLTGTIGDVLKSEAGMVALLDRSVQMGQFGAPVTFQKACQHIADVYRPQSIEELAGFEAWIIPKIQNRIDVLHEGTLSQPNPPPIGDFPLTQPEPKAPGPGVPEPRHAAGIPEVSATA
jgi:hypothetical protein